MKKLVIILIFGLFFCFLNLFPKYVLAYCFEPTEPDVPYTTYRPSKLHAPYCINSYSNTHSCSEWEIDSYNYQVRQYNSDVEDYIRKLKSYVSDAQDFAEEALEYANCEIRNLD